MGCNGSQQMILMGYKLLSSSVEPLSGDLWNDDRQGILLPHPIAGSVHTDNSQDAQISEGKTVACRRKGNYGRRTCRLDAVDELARLRVADIDAGALIASTGDVTTIKCEAYDDMSARASHAHTQMPSVR